MERTICSYGLILLAVICCGCETTATVYYEQKISNQLEHFGDGLIRAEYSVKSNNDGQDTGRATRVVQSKVLDLRATQSDGSQRNIDNQMVQRQQATNQ